MMGNRHLPSVTISHLKSSESARTTRGILPGPLSPALTFQEPVSTTIVRGVAEVVCADVGDGEGVGDGEEGDEEELEDGGEVEKSSINVAINTRFNKPYGIF